MGNCHIYEEHLEIVKQQTTRIPFEFPDLEIINKRENINDYVISDFKISKYTSHDAIKMKIIA